jgi:hypothetical protein
VRITVMSLERLHVLRQGAVHERADEGSPLRQRAGPVSFPDHDALVEDVLYQGSQMASFFGAALGVAALIRLVAGLQGRLTIPDLTRKG